MDEVRDESVDDAVDGETPEEIMTRALDALIAPGQVVEMRVLGIDGRGGVDSGYFNDPQKLVAAALRYDNKADGIYITLNPVNPDLLSRAANRVQQWAKHTTHDQDIVARRWLLIDLDPDRATGISATDAEHMMAKRRASDVMKHLRSEGWSRPIVASSGNGLHLLYRIDLPRDDDRLVERVLKALAFRFNDDKVKVDTGVHNPARICKLYGTTVRKGDHTPERPHCYADLVSVPSEIVAVPRDLLEAVAATLPEGATKGGGHPSRQLSGVQPPNGGFDLDAWIEKHVLEVDGPFDWQGSRKWTFDVCPWNEDHTNRSAFIVQLESGAIAAGCLHTSCREKKWQDLRDVVEPGWRKGSDGTSPKIHDEQDHRTPPTVADNAELAAFDDPWRPSEPVAVDGVTLVCLSDVEVRPVSWLWPGFIPLGKLAVLDGDPGLGKSTITLDLAARVTTGSPMPDGTPSDLDGPASVILLTAEDGLADTIKPRLVAAGCDDSRVFALQAIGTGEHERMPSLADYAKLEETITRTHAKLVIVDPLMAYLPEKIDAHKDQAIRRVLNPLKEVAERTGAAILVVRHLNKGKSENPMYRGGGSIGIIGAVRSGLIVAPDPTDETGMRRILAVQKMNVAARAESLVYCVEDDGFGVGRIKWLGKSTQTADSLFAPAETTDEGQEGRAKAFLRDLLSDGPVAANEVKQLATEAGIKERTLERAKKALGVTSNKQGFDGGFVWSLPRPEDRQDDRRPPTSIEDRQPPEDGNQRQSAA